MERAAAAPVGALLQLRLLGPLRAWGDESPNLLPRGRKAQALLAYLAHAGGPVRRARIAGLLWDRVTDDQARNSLRQALAELNLALQPLGPGLIAAGREEVLLRPERCRSDLALFDRGVPTAAELPRPAGPLLEDLDGISVAFDQWLAEERARTESRLRDLFEARIERLWRDDAPAAERVAAAKELLRFDPTHERAWRLVIRALADLGDLGQALGEYRRCEETLRRLLDTAPSAETQALRGRLKAEEPRAGPGAAPASAATPRPQAAGAPALSPDRQASIAVLPFAVQSTEPHAAFLASAIGEGLIHLLSGIGDLFVIARGTTLAYAGRAADPRQVGRELGVRYVLTGSLMVAAGRLVVFTELAESASGRVVRTDRRDAACEDMFRLQDAVATEIVAAIAPSVRAHELARARRAPPSSLTAYDILLKGLDLLYRLDRPDFEQAGVLLRQAMRLDPGFAAVRSHAATWHNFRIGQGWSPDPAADGAAAARLSAEALDLDHNDAIALAIQGQVLSFTRRDYTGARQFLDRAVAVGPSCPMAWALSSATHGWTGDGPRAIEHATRSLQLSPFDHFAFFAEHMLSQGHYVAGDFEAAVEWGRRAAARNGQLTSNLRTLAAALVACGRVEVAREVARRMMRLEPEFRLARFLARTPFSQPLREIHGQRLRQAGLPD